jgi:hypothetical protein
MSLFPCALAAQARTSLVVVSGVSGDKRIALDMNNWSADLVAAAKARFALPDSQVYYFAEDSTRGRGRSSKVNLETTFARLAGGSRDGDRMVVVLFGHGNAQAEVTRFNLPGPDMTVDDFVKALAPFKGTVAFVHTGSASGEFAKALKGPGRLVITATKSAREQNETFFPRHFVRALAAGAGDADKDGRVSLLEAFTYARKEVERFFEQDNRLASEHPMLEDDGDGVAHSDASERGPDGRLARSFFLEPLGGAAVAANPQAAQLIEDRRRIEQRLDSLRSKRGGMSEEAYQRALEPLMIELAQKTQALRALEAKKP